MVFAISGIVFTGRDNLWCLNDCSENSYPTALPAWLRSFTKKDKKSGNLIIDITHLLFNAGRKGVKGAQPGPVLSWQQRVKIAVGAAKGLEYLHEKADPHIIHRDIKSSNVLIFDDDVAKIADFDLSNQAPDMAARLHSTRVLGTFGYHAPE